MCQVKIKDTHNSFYFGSPSKKACTKQAVQFLKGAHMCQHHYNRAIKKQANKPNK